MKLQLFKERAQSERTRDLKKVALFAGLSRREIGVVQGFMHERHFLRDEVVFDEGEKGEAFYIVLKGAVLVCHQGQPDKPIATLEAGKFFGELALLDDAPRSAQVRAADECTLLVLFRGDFLGLMQSHGLIASKIAIELARQLGARLRTSSVAPTSHA